MKKKTKTKAPKTTRKRSTKRVSPRASQTASPVSFSFRRIVIWSGIGALLLFIFTPTRHTVSHAVEGASIFRPLYAQATVHWPGVDSAVTYNVYYRQKGDTEFPNAIRDIPANITTYTISYLKKGIDYEYKISAKDSNGAEFWWSDLQTLSDITSM